MTDLQLGCFGSVLMFNKEDQYCSICPLVIACEEATLKAQAQLQEALGKPIYEKKGFWTQSATVSRHRRAMAMRLSTPELDEQLSPPPVKLIASVVTPPTGEKFAPYDALHASSSEGMASKARQHLELWVAKGIDPSLMDKRINPFTGVPGMSSAEQIAAALLKLGSPTKRELKDEVVATQLTLGLKPWTDGTAGSQINIVTDAFRVCGYQVIREKE